MTLSLLMDIPEAAWLEAIPGIEGVAAAMLAATLDRATPELMKGEVEIGLVLTDDASMRNLNREHRGLDKATNVLSFPLSVSPRRLPGVPLPLGDIVLGLGVVEAEAARDAKSLVDHVRHLLVHGLLHLLGYDHELGEQQADAMEMIEIEVLSGFGVSDPYITSEASAFGQR